MTKSNPFERERMKREIEEEVKKEFQEKIRKGEIVVKQDNPQKELQKTHSEIAKNLRLIK